MKVICLSFIMGSMMALQRQVWGKNNILQARDVAIEAAPSGEYTPVTESCPASFHLNTSPNLSEAELNYIAQKNSKVVPLWAEYLNRANLEDFDISAFLDRANSAEEGPIPGKTLPSIGFAASGGGHRAMLYSSSILAAFDGREAAAVEAGTGGILQLITWLSGVSGGAWLVGSWAAANFPKFEELQGSWKLTRSSRYTSLSMVKEMSSYVSALKKKNHAGFPVSLIDLWGRIVARKLINAPANSKKVLLSSIRETPIYQGRTMPFPILLAVSRPGERAKLTLDSPIYEFSAEDFGVAHPGINASIPIQYLGTPPPGAGKANICVEGFDNIGFVLGASSNVFSSFDSIEGQSTLWGRVGKKFGVQDIYEALVPNTFEGQGVRGLNPDMNRDTLLLADGGFAGEKLPLFPLIRRKADVIIASDAGVDGGGSMFKEAGYPNGTSLYMTYLKLQQPLYRGYSFPTIPNTFNTSFIAQGFNQRPTFFGCEQPEVPLVIYLPNYYMVAKTDMKTTKSWFTIEQIKGFFKNGKAIATQTIGERLRNPTWSAALACALVDRQRWRNGQPRTAQCAESFQKYCA